MTLDLKKVLLYIWRNRKVKICQKKREQSTMVLGGGNCVGGGDVSRGRLEWLPITVQQRPKSLPRSTEPCMTCCCFPSPSVPAAHTSALLPSLSSHSAGPDLWALLRSCQASPCHCLLHLPWMSPQRFSNFVAR